MCARYTMTTTPEVLIAELDAVLATEAPIPPRYNLAPTDPAPIVLARKDTPERQLTVARFGLVPHWAKDPRIGARMLNARVETVAEKPAYRDALTRHRCLVAADGFYEWRTEGRVKTPFRFVLPDRSLFAMAGLYARWQDPTGEWITSFTIVTREAVGAVAALHDRMPVLLPKGAYAAWLDRAIADRDGPLALLEAHDGARLVSYEVSRLVNSVRNDDASLIEPAPPAGSSTLPL